ncbi:MAG: branched-chain amino acid aminotransferase [Deltaproteobacteria bacterium]|nr:branched-chain amino acid aminotransferase [Deltaproteobacteria bacterium]
MKHSKKDSVTGAEKVFVNGRFLSAKRASISVFDRGLTYGDGLFETIRAYEGRLFALDRHLSRLRRGLDELGIPPITETSIEEMINKLLRHNRLDSSDAYIRLTVTRGTDYGGLLPSEDIIPSIIIIARKIDTRKIETWQRDGVSVSLLEGYPPPLPHMKTLNYLPSLVAKMDAVKKGTAEGLFVQEGFVTEGTTSNIFTVKQGVLRTPLADGTILPGVTREIILELAERSMVPWSESPITTTEIMESEEAFISNSILEIAPVIGVDGLFIGNGRSGSTTRLLQKAYRDLIIETDCSCSR